MCLCSLGLCLPFLCSSGSKGNQHSSPSRLTPLLVLGNVSSCSWFFLGGYLLANIFCWICLLFLPSLALKANLYKDSAWVFLPLTCCCPWTEVSFAQLLKLYPYSDQEETIGDLFVSLGPVLSSSYIRTFAVYATILCLHHSTQCFILEPKILCFVPYMF